MILVIEINDFCNALLDQSLGAFVAGEERNIDCGTGKVAFLGIKDRIELGMSNKRILRIEHSAGSCPGEFLVITADREAVITDG